jgi:molybdopterin-guanine dinucleotide biosynthesis protein A
MHTLKLNFAAKLTRSMPAKLRNIYNLQYIYNLQSPNRCIFKEITARSLSHMRTPSPLDGTAPDTNVTALVLAGGLSSRMGQDKALMPIQGIPMLRRVCAIAAQCCQQVMVVTPWPQRYQGLVPKGRFVLETRPSDQPEPPGPLVAFALGLKQVLTDWVLLLACDLPQLDVDTLREGIARLPELDPSVLAFVPRDLGMQGQQKWHPLCAFYHQRCLISLEDFINHRGGRSFQAWLADLNPQEWYPLNREILFNCNTPEDLGTLHQSSATPGE